MKNEEREMYSRAIETHNKIKQDCPQHAEEVGRLICDLLQTAFPIKAPHILDYTDPKPQ
jgi:hypothetical protein